MSSKFKRNNLTGEVYEVDAEGKKIQTIKLPESRGSLIPQPQNYIPTQPTPTDLPPNVGRDFLRAIPPTIQAGSSFFGGLPGAAIGSVGANTLKYLDPQAFGEGSEDLEGAAINVGTDLAIDQAFSLVPKIAKLAFPSARGQLKQEALRRLFPSNLSKEQTEALRVKPDFDVSVGQTSGLGKFLENVFAPVKKRQFVQKQEEGIKNYLDQFKINPEELIKTGQVNAQIVKDTLKSKTKLAYQNLEPEIEKNTRQISVPLTYRTTGQYGRGNPQVRMVTKDIKGAIEVPASLNFTKQVGSQIDEILGPNDINAANIGVGAGARTKALRVELDKIRGITTQIDPTTGTSHKAPFISYTQAKGIKDAIRRYMGSDEYLLNKDRFAGSLDALNKILGADIDAGVKAWGPKAQRLHETAKRHATKQALTVNTPLAEKLLKAGTDPETTYMQVAQDAMSDPMKTRQFVKITGDRATTKQLWMDQNVEAAIDPATGNYSIKQALEHLEKNRLVFNEAVSSSTRSNYERFLKRAQLVEPYTENTNLALRFRQGQATIGIVGGVIGGLIEGNIGSGLKWGTLTIAGISSMKQFTERVLFNPENARIATKLLDMPPISPTAKNLTRTLLLGLKGTQVILTTPDGTSNPAVINNQGKVKILDTPKTE